MRLEQFLHPECFIFDSQVTNGRRRVEESCMWLRKRD
jgi:hypothetical protein